MEEMVMSCNADKDKTKEELGATEMKIENLEKMMNNDAINDFTVVLCRI